MRKVIDIAGQRFGRLVVQEFAGRIKNTSMWFCKCDCGNTKRVNGHSLKIGVTRSCGCLMKEARIRHNQSRTPLYAIWLCIKQRCYNPNNPEYKNYGGRGIKMCDRWWYLFQNFYEDMGDRPKGRTLDRKDNDGDYCKENCRWGTQEEQNRNRRDNAWYKFEGETKILAQWARDLGIKPKTLWARLNKYGWSEERAFTTLVEIK
jgi:hypothetical protein